MPTSKLSTGTKRLEWVRVSDLRISPRAQRDHDKPGAQKLIEEIVANFDPDRFGTLVVSERGGIYWVVDGGHRCTALVRMDYGDQLVQCWVYHDLSEEDEADLFLDLNNVRPVNAMDKFKVAVVAGRAIESDIDRIARLAGLSVGGGGGKDGHIRCVAALRKVYATGGPIALEATLGVVKDAYGLPGFSAKVVEGIGQFVTAYEGQYDRERLVSRLAKKMGGVNGLIGRAEQIRSSHGVPAAEGVAAATVETYNQGRGGMKLIGWWANLDKREA